MVACVWRFVYIFGIFTPYVVTRRPSESQESQMNPRACDVGVLGLIEAV